MKTSQRLQFPSPKPFWVCSEISTSLLLYCWGKHFQKIKENKLPLPTLKLVGVSMNIWSLQCVSIPSKTSTMTFCPGLLWLLSHSSPWKAGDSASIPPKNKIKMPNGLMDLFSITGRAYPYFYRNIDQLFDLLSGFCYQSANLLDWDDSKCIFSLHEVWRLVCLGLHLKFHHLDGIVLCILSSRSQTPYSIHWFQFLDTEKVVSLFYCNIYTPIYVYLISI